MELELVSCDRVFARVEEELSSFGNNGLLDTGKFFPRIRVFLETLGLSACIDEECVVVVKDYKVELPRDFYLLDSAWLCDKCNSFTQSAFQGEFQIYTKKTCEEVGVNGCQYNSYFGIKTSDCPETILDKVTIEQWINSENTASITWRNPVLLSLGNKVSKNVCSKTCSNIFSKCPENISIRKQGDCYVLYSNLKDATILLKYYKYPLDENNLPMIPDSPIFEEALFYDLQLYLFKQKWYNNEIVNVENKIKSLESDRAYAMQRAIDYVKIPTVRELMQIANRQRTANMSYEVKFMDRWINFRN